MSDADQQPEQRQLRNTLYRKVTRGRRRLSRGRMLVYRVAVFVAWRLIHVFWATCRVQRVLGGSDGDNLNLSAARCRCCARPADP